MSSRSLSHTPSRSRMRSSWDSASHAESGQLSSRGDDTSPSAKVEEDIVDNIARNAQAESTPLHRLSSPPPDPAHTHMSSAAWTERVETVATVPLAPSPGEEHDAEAQAVPRTGDESIRVRRGAGGAGRRNPLPRTRFGLNTYQLRGQASQGAPRDYKQKYAEDPPYKELVSDARVWLVYNDESAIFDNDMIIESGDSLDILLVFAGLFSAQALSLDNTAISNSILLELVALQRAQANGTSFESIPAANTSFTVSRTDIWVNGLWFTSLMLSLSTALLAVLAKQWLHQYSLFIAGSPRTRALIRQFRLRLLRPVGLLPTVLHLSLFLFMVGLVVFLFPLDRTLARVVACIAGFLCGTYIITNFLPIIIIQCPYRTPLSVVLYPLYHPARALAILVIKVAVFVLMIPYTFVRVALGCAGLMEKRGPWLPPKSVTLPKHIMGESLRETERTHVEDEDKQWTNLALLWLARTTSDPSAKAILVEALGAEGAEDPPLDHDLLLPIFTQQWDTAVPRLIAGGPGTPGDESTLGRLIRATMFHNIHVRPDHISHSHARSSPIFIMLDSLPTTPISATDYATILAIACLLPHLPICNVLEPYKAFAFVIEHYTVLDELVAPTWMWWSICTQAAIGPEQLSEKSGGRAKTLLRICMAEERNIRRYEIEMKAWLEQLQASVPADLRRAVKTCLRENSGLYFSDICRGTPEVQPPASSRGTISEPSHPPNSSHHTVSPSSNTSRHSSPSISRPSSPQFLSSCASSHSS
ncbi:hypothetical protein C8J57DRAFT_1324605 [Mycena rebaudengoi]|nr:hypothetical protein C8J57DRAFT_1324605 [Mycena rebaudengoi]